MARALELLRTQAPDELVADFLHWVNHELMPQVRVGVAALPAANLLLLALWR